MQGISSSFRNIEPVAITTTAGDREGDRVGKVPRNHYELELKISRQEEMNRVRTSTSMIGSPLQGISRSFREIGPLAMAVGWVGRISIRRPTVSYRQRPPIGSVKSLP